MVDVDVSQPLHSLVSMVHILHCMLSPHSLSSLLLSLVVGSSDIYRKPTLCCAFYSQLKSKVGNILAKATALRINLNIDGAPIASHVHTPTHKPVASYPLPSPSVPPSPDPPSV